MTDFKKEISQAISKATGIEENEIYGYIEIPKDANNGNYAFPCFKLAKTLKKAPPTKKIDKLIYKLIRKIDLINIEID